MYTITIHTEVRDLVLKAKKTPAHDKVLQLPWTIFEKFPILFKRKDWAKSMKNITDYTGIKLKIDKVDGRDKAIRNLDWFNWPRVFSFWLEYRNCIVCSVCGKIEDVSNWSNGEIMKQRRMCFTCNFWQDQLDLDNSGKRQFAIIDNHHYVIEPDTIRGFKGFSGALHKIQFNDGRIVTTKNLWHQGQIPEKWQAKFQNNAKFIH